jgi:hypothetical protein
MRRKSISKDESAGEKPALAPRARIGVMMKGFVESNQYSPAYHYSCLKRWEAGKVIHNAADIDRLLSLNAPIKVYIEDVNGCAER